MNKITYRSLRGWKYSTESVFEINIEKRLDDSVVSSGGYIMLSKYGVMCIKKGYAWDGPSGPAIDTYDFMRASLVHDALYQLIREGMVPRSWRKHADVMMRKMCIEDGMSRTRAWLSYRAVRTFGESALKQEKPRHAVTIIRGKKVH